MCFPLSLGFFQYVVSPLFKAWDQFVGTGLSAEMLDHLSENESRWKRCIDRGEVVSELTDDEDSDLENDNDERSQSQTESETLHKDACEIHIDTREEDINSRPVIDEKNVPKIMLKSCESKEGNILIEEDEPAEAPTTRECEDKENRNEKTSKVNISENDVNFLYHFPVSCDQNEASIRCLSPVCEDSNVLLNSPLRRFSLPYIRRDLAFYLGLRLDGDGNLQDDIGQFLRRQSLPVTAMYFHGSSEAPVVESSPKNHNPKSRSLSMDILLMRPKISNLSPSLEASFAGGGLDPGAFIPLHNQTVMLQGGSLTRFTYNQHWPRRSSADPAIDLTKASHVNKVNVSDLSIPPFSKTHQSYSNNKLHISCVNENRRNRTGLASSWPKLTPHKTTNGCLHQQNPALNTSHSNSFYKGQKPQHLHTNVLLQDQNTRILNLEKHKDFQTNHLQNQSEHSSLTGSSSVEERGNNSTDSISLSLSSGCT